MIANVRPMKKADKPAIMGILRNTPEFLPSEVVVAEEVIDSYLDDSSRSGYMVLVSEDQDRLSGYVCYGPVPMTQSTWDIYWIAVGRELQGRGIGGRLLAAAEKDIGEKQGRRCMLETSSKPGYERTHSFYLSRGWQVICRIPDYYAPNDDLLIFSKLPR